MTKVAAPYGVSSSFLARVCERPNVPRPSRGYWAQLEVGKASAKPALPEARPGDELDWSREGEPRRVPRALPQPPSKNEPPPRRRRRERPSRHELIVGAREHFEGAKECGAARRPQRARRACRSTSDARRDGANHGERPESPPATCRIRKRSHFQDRASGASPSRREHCERVGERLRMRSKLLQAGLLARLSRFVSR